MKTAIARRFVDVYVPIPLVPEGAPKEDVDAWIGDAVWAIELRDQWAQAASGEDQ